MSSTTELTNLFKTHFTFAIALTAAQRCVKSTPAAVVPYMLASISIILVIKVMVPNLDEREATGAPFKMLATQTVQVVTQILSSLLGTWLTSMIGDGASSDKLLAAAILGLIMVWISKRTLSRI